MEQFKTVEKESKMKAYSKEALAKKSRDTKKKKLEPHEIKCCERIEEWINTLQDQVDNNEESVREVQRSKKPDQEEVERLEDINRTHRSYVEKLRESLKLLKNGVIEVEDIEQIAEDLEYYIDSHADIDFIENEFLFDAINEKKEGNNDEDDDSELLEIPEIEDETQSDSEESPRSQLRINDVLKEEIDEEIKREKFTEKVIDKVVEKSNDKSTSSVADKSSIVDKSAIDKTDKKDRKKVDDKKIKQKKVVPSPTPAIPPQPIVSYRDVIAAADDKIDNTKPSISITKKPSPIETSSKSPSPQAFNITPPGYANQLKTNVQVAGSPYPGQISQQFPPLQSQHNLQTNIPQQLSQNLSPYSQSFGGSPLPQRILKRAIPVESRLLRSLYTLPSDIDTEFPDAHNPINPAETPDFFPQYRHPKFNSSEFFARASITSPDLLFFAFYFQPGKFQQELAAKELSKSWRFHANLKAWFKNLQLTEKTREYESGSFIYFDFEDSWSQKILNQYKFIYSEASIEKH